MKMAVMTRAEPRSDLRTLKEGDKPEEDTGWAGAPEEGLSFFLNCKKVMVFIAAPQTTFESKVDNKSPEGFWSGNSW
jgi:hypothetical protein